MADVIVVLHEIGSSELSDQGALMAAGGLYAELAQPAVVMNCLICAACSTVCSGMLVTSQAYG